MRTLEPGPHIRRKGGSWHRSHFTWPVDPYGKVLMQAITDASNRRITWVASNGNTIVDGFASRLYCGSPNNAGGGVYVNPHDDGGGTHSEDATNWFGSVRNTQTTWTHVDINAVAYTVTSTRYAQAERRAGIVYRPTYQTQHDSISWDCAFSTMANWLNTSSWVMKAYRLMKSYGWMGALIPTDDLIELAIGAGGVLVGGGLAVYLCSKVPSE